MSFEDFTSKSGDKSSVWHYFLRGQNEAKCKLCQKILRSAGGTTSGLRKHLKNIHLLNLTPENEKQADSSNFPSNPSSSFKEEHDIKKRKLSDYFKTSADNSTADRICRMISLDGVPMRIFTKSEDLRAVFDKAGQTLPKSSNTIREIMLKECNKKRNALVVEIKQLKSEDRKFSISLDEWTSNRNRRYLSLNLHSQHFSGVFKFRNLGLLRVYGTMPASRCMEQITQKLSEYGLSLNTDLIAAVSDGCSVMSKMGNNLPCYHQKCIAHAVQLAIIDVFYKNTPIQVEERIGRQEVENSGDEEITLAEFIRRRSAENQGEQFIGDEENDESESDGEDGVVFEGEPADRSVTEQSEFRFHNIISKVRHLVKIFRKSPTKNDDILQKYVKEEFGKEYTLILDVKTRWNSMADMIGRFLKLKSPIAKALIDLKTDIVFSEQDLKTLQELHEVFEILKILIEALCRRDATILTAQIAIKFALRKLSEMRSLLGVTMGEALKNRYIQRRLSQTPILHYLQNPETYFAERENEDQIGLSRPTGLGMRYAIVDLLQRTANSEISDVAISIAQQATSSLAIRDNVSLTYQFNQELKKSLLQDRSSCSSDISSSVQVEMALYENGGNMGRYLSMAYDYLMTIPPTSVEPERIFSSAGFICSKLRTSLSDKSVDAISFLRTYYQDKKALMKTD